MDITPDVVGCTYKITVIVKNENGLGELDRFKKFVICRSGDIQIDGPLGMPLSLDKYFQLNFTSSEGNPDLEFSAYETLFDNGGNQNIVVEKVSNNKLRFKLLDYGAYCIKVWPVGFEDRASKIIIEKYSRPTYEVSDTEWLEDLEGTAYDIVAQCDTTIFIPSKTSQYVTGIRDSLTVRIGNSPVLQERFYAKAYLKYFYNSYLYIGENMNMCHSLYRVGVEDIVLQKGEDSLYNLPEVINFRYTQGNRVHDYFGYYAVVIPPDRFEFIGYDSDSDNLNN